MWSLWRQERRIEGWVGERETDHLRNLGVDGMIILKWILKLYDRGVNWFGLAQDEGQVTRSYESCNEFSGSIKCGKFLD
jgi:hypothetical protein